MLGYIVTLIGGLIMLTWYALTGLTIYSFIVPMLLIGLGATFSMGAGAAGCMIPFGKQPGAASALSNAARLLFSAVVGLLVANYVHSVLPVAIPAVLFSVVGVILFLRYKDTLQFD